MERLNGAAKALTGPYGSFSAPEQQVCQTAAVHQLCHLSICRSSQVSPPPFGWQLKKTHGFRPIVHRAGGMLLQAKKEFVICADLKEEDVFFYYTTT